MDLGIAFQLTNIARDVMDDARLGRVYLPGDWLAQAGVPVGKIQDIRYRPGVFQVVHHILEEAERYYESASFGIRRLSFRSAWAIAAAKEIYRDTGRIVLKRGAGAWDERATTSSSRKLLLATKGGVQAFAARALGVGLESSSRSGLWSKSGPFQAV
jgi:phytoene synthase